MFAISRLSTEQVPQICPSRVRLVHLKPPSNDEVDVDRCVACSIFKNTLRNGVTSGTRKYRACYLTLSSARVQSWQSERQASRSNQQRPGAALPRGTVRVPYTSARSLRMCVL